MAVVFSVERQPTTTVRHVNAPFGQNKSNKPLCTQTRDRVSGGVTTEPSCPCQNQWHGEGERRLTSDPIVQGS